VKRIGKDFMTLKNDLNALSNEMQSINERKKGLARVWLNLVQQIDSQYEKNNWENQLEQAKNEVKQWKAKYKEIKARQDKEDIRQEVLGQHY
jgi:chromosome segregation ATPase